MAKLPRAIQAQVDAAQEIMDAQAAPAVVETPPQAEQPSEQPPAETPAETPVHETPTESVDTTPAPKLDPWEARYRSLQGLFNKQMPALQATNRELQAQLDALRAQQARKPETDVSLPKVETTTEYDADPEVMGQVQAALTRVMGPVLAKVNGVLTGLEGRMATIEQQVKGQGASLQMTAGQMFERELQAMVPDWRATNERQEFLDWLADVDPMLGVQRQEVLNAAHNALDAGRVAAVFRAFTDAHPTTKPTNTSVPAAVAKQVSPGKAASAPAPQPTEKPVFSAQKVHEFYMDVSRGKYRGRESEQAQLEQAINEAMAEGRIR